MGKPITPLLISGLMLGLTVAACDSDSTSASSSSTSSSSSSTSGGAGGGGAGGSGAGGVVGGGGTAGSCNGGAGGGGDCIACMLALETTDCQEVFETCRNNQSCEGWLACVELCANEDNSIACYQVCDQQFLISNSANQNLKSCACNNCATDCKALCPCNP